MLLQREPSGASFPGGLQNSLSCMQQLQGNLLHTLIAPNYPNLAGKITGMLLELSPEEIASILADEGTRVSMIADAIAVLRAAGEPVDEVQRAPAAPPHVPRLALTVNTDTDDSLVPEPPYSAMRISPRNTDNPYSSANILCLSPDGGGLSPDARR